MLPHRRLEPGQAGGETHLESLLGAFALQVEGLQGEKAPDSIAAAAVEEQRALGLGEQAGQGAGVLLGQARGAAHRQGDVRHTQLFDLRRLLGGSGLAVGTQIDDRPEARRAGLGELLGGGLAPAQDALHRKPGIGQEPLPFGRNGARFDRALHLRLGGTGPEQNRGQQP